jgi:uncharacterized protein YkwD
MGVRLLAACVAVQLVLLALCANASASPACPTDELKPTLENAYDTAMSVVCDINAARTDHGLKPLRWDWRLWVAAQRMANDMAARRYASHVTPEGQTLANRVAPTGYIPPTPTWLLAENLGWGTSVLSTPLSIVIGWIQSPEHRENMLDPQLEDIGVGIQEGAISENGQVGTIYVADFGMRGTPIASIKIHGRAGRSRKR